ncbi:hypothetical protein RB597_007684 [Gaeumannomyces tritici]
MSHSLAKGVASRCLALCSVSGLSPAQHIWAQASKHVSTAAAGRSAYDHDQAVLESASRRHSRQQPWMTPAQTPNLPAEASKNTITALGPFSYKKSQTPAPIALRIPPRNRCRDSEPYTTPSPPQAMSEPAAATTTTTAFVRAGSPSYNFTVADPALQARFGCSMHAFLDREYTNTTTTTALGSVKPQCLATGAVVFNASRTAVLLVQRSASDSMPGLWETPGGGVDADDATVLSAVVRELWEEVGLRAASVRFAVPCRGHDDDVDGDHDDALTQVFLTRRGRVVAKFNFVVDIEDDDAAAVVLDSREHQAYVWATEEECVRGARGEVQLPITTREQREVILNAWRIVKGL